MAFIEDQLKRVWGINPETGNRAPEKNMKLVVLPIEMLVVLVECGVAGIPEIPAALN